MNWLDKEGRSLPSVTGGALGCRVPRWGMGDMGARGADGLGGGIRDPGLRAELISD